MKLPRAVTQHLHSSASASAEALASAVADRLREGLDRSARASLLVPGGRTPVLFQQTLSRQSLDWSKVSISLSDDRWLPADHADSNELLLRRNLLQGPAAAARFVSLVDASVSALSHLVAAETAFDSLSQPLDAVVLGIGEDGHTASLFPDAAETLVAIDPTNGHRLAIIQPTSAPYTRISATLNALLNAKIIYILAQGDAKRAALEGAATQSKTTLALAAILNQQDVPVHLYYNP